MIMLSNETINKFLNKSNTFNDYQEQYNSLENCVISFVNILKNRINKKKNIVKDFLKNKIRSMRYKNLIKNNPCNELDLYTLEKYDVNNKNNIYLIDVTLNKKWWFTIETISKLICNNLSYFDGESYDVNCKTPVNPYINKSLTLGQLTSLYEQISRKTNVQKLITLFRLVNFSINKFLKLYNDDIINYSYKYNLESLDNEGLIIILHNLFYEYDINYVNADKLDLTTIDTKNDTRLLIKECCLTYKKNHVRKIKLFINKYKYIIKRASRNFNNNNDNNNDTNNTNNTNITDSNNMIVDDSNNTNNDTEMLYEDLNNTYIEIEFYDDESLNWTTDEDSVDNVCSDMENLNTN